MRLTLKIFLVLLLFNQCKTSKQDLDKNQENNEKSLAEKELGEISEELLNADKSMLLAVGVGISNNPSIPNEMKKFIVIKVSINEVLYSGVIEGGYVKWLDNENLETFSSPGMIQENQNKDDLIQVINVITSEKMSKTLYNAKNR
ncbi:MAG: hypothetical protein JXR07_17515 [Reichenbachiella sp.]